MMKMMRKRSMICMLLTFFLCVSLAAPAYAMGSEPVDEEPASVQEPAEEQPVTVVGQSSGALTPTGNLSIVDDYYTNYSDGSGQQFITLVSKSGAYFYLVIDRNADGDETVHFMNLVDETDLLALMDEDQQEAYNAEKEAAAQAELDRQKAEEEASKAAEEAAKEESEDKKEDGLLTRLAGSVLGIVALVGLAVGGGGYYLHQQKLKKKAAQEAVDPDADYNEHEDYYDVPDAPLEDNNSEDGEDENLS